ncbi:hypothetical protein B0H13DRAFT_1893303 [Mycena leptocephala]|nr:hypothetical protein B0H13DRAFT_1893303 [Mycena leptocephala]
MPKHPTQKYVKFRVIEQDFGAKFFTEALTRYVAELSYQTLTRNQLENAANDVDLFFNSLPVFQRIKFSTSDPYGNNGPEDKIVHAIHVQPGRTLDNVTARFYTPLVNTGDGGQTGARGYQIAQVCVVFTIPAKKSKTIFPPSITSPKYLTYIEWFSPFTKEPERNHLMYEVSRTETDDLLTPPVIIIPSPRSRTKVDEISPKFSKLCQIFWRKHNLA